MAQVTLQVPFDDMTLIMKAIAKGVTFDIFCPIFDLSILSRLRNIFCTLSMVL